MQKLSIILASAVVAFSFISCNKQEINNIPTSNEISFSINANIDETTKTTLDPNTYEVAWENGDILYVVTADETWGQAFKSDNDGNTIKDFTYDSGTKLFTSDATIAPGTYTFHAAYSRADQRSYHRGASTTALISSTQTQDCANPTAHIKANDYLYGVAEATIEAESTPTLNFNMTHVGVLMQVNFTNNTGAEVELTKMEMILESGDLAGIFNIGFTGTPAISSTKSGYGSTITLNVSNGTVANGASLPLYFVMAPIADYSGDVTFRFTDSASNTYTLTKEKTGLTFAANTYNTATISATKADYKYSNYSEEITLDAANNSTKSFSITSNFDYEVAISGSNFKIEVGGVNAVGQTFSGTTEFTITALTAGGAALSTLGTISFSNTVEVSMPSITVKQAGTASPKTVWSDDFTGKTSSSTALTSLSCDSGSYTITGSVYPCHDFIRFGKSSGEGYIETAALSEVEGTNKTLTVSFKAAGWNNKSSMILISATNGTTSVNEMTMPAATAPSSGDMTTSNVTLLEYSFTVTGASSATTIKFGCNGSSNRFFLDDLVIVSD